MAAFSYQQNRSFLLDQPVFFPNPSSTVTAGATTTAGATSFPYFHHDNYAFYGHHHDQPDSSNPTVLDDQKSESGNEFFNKKRKDNYGESKDTSKRLKKQKKTNDYEEEKKKKNNNTKKGSEEEEGAIGYIHVRARRGQATDSHSLAERVRREKISERMKLLQAIVPGCDKVTGKALMLDEIINYVQSLQNQVEFLSMKLASVNPMLYDFGLDLDAFMFKPDEKMSNMVLPIMPSVQQCCLNGGATTLAGAQATDNYHHLPQLIDGSLLFPQSQMSNVISQGNGQHLWDLDEQRLKIDNRFALSNNLNSFH